MSRIGLTSSGQAPLKEHLSASGIISHHPRAQDAGTVRVGLEYRNQLFENGHLSLAKAGCWFVSRGIALGGVVIDWVSATVWLEGTDRKSTRLNSSHQCATRMSSSPCKTKVEK